jgi:hypothetical protein
MAAVLLTSALVVGLLATTATPAHADHQVRVSPISGVDLKVGGQSQTVNLQVTNGNHNGGEGDGTASGVSFKLVVPLDNLGVYIDSDSAGGGANCSLNGSATEMDCSIDDIGPNQTWTGSVRIAAAPNSSLPPGESRNGTGQMTLTGSVFSGSQTFNVRLNGPDKAPQVAEISGTLLDIDTGEPIPNARVLLVDGAENTHEVGTNDQGLFRFRDLDIAPGSIGLQARTEGYEGIPWTGRAEAGERLTDIPLRARSTATPTPTASASATATPTATASASVAALPVKETSGGGTFFTTLMVVLGLTLVLAGGAAIVFMIWRRRRDDDEGFEDEPVSGPRGPQPLPGRHGAYRPSPTRVIGDAPTQISRPGGGPPLPAVGPRPALADAPTMLHGAAGADQTTVLPRHGSPPLRPPASGAPGPPPAAPGYGQPGYGSPVAPTSAGGHQGGYSGPPPGPSAGYGNPSGYGEPATPGYGATAAPSGGYGAEQPTYGGYVADQPTGRHGYAGSGQERPEPASGSGYGPDPYVRPASPAPGYGQPSYGQPGYEQPGYEQPGYEQPGYEQPRYGQPGYGQQPSHGQPGYGGRPGYGGSGYESGHRQADYGGRPAYPPEPVAEQPGHAGDHYDNSGQNSAQPRPRHAEPPDRRRLDWLDN